MDYETSSIKDVETALPLDDKENEGKHNREPLEDDQAPVKLEIFKEEDDFSENKYLPVKEEEEHNKVDPNYKQQRGNENVYDKEIKSEEPDSFEFHDAGANVEEFISSPILTDEPDHDPFEVETDVEKEIMSKELKASGDGVLNEDIMDLIYCDDCGEYSRVKAVSFRHELQSFCDTCYQKRLTKSKSDWMDVMYEWYESCTICMNMFYNNLDMVNHDCTCENAYYCDNCALIFVKKEDIERHLLICVCQSRSLSNIATGKSIFGRTCVTEGTDSVSHLSTDKRYILRCIGEVGDDIKKKISSTSSYKKNKTLPVNKSYKCNHCDQYLRSASELKVHLGIHSGEKPYSCHFCKKSFSQLCHLKRHLRRTHSGEKPYSCQTCKKSFSESRNLKRHLRTHSGEKPYSCQTCKKSFSESRNLKRHLRTHSGEKPYSCQICKKSFSESGTLKNHLRTHSGEKPYSCQICKKSFPRPNALKEHQRTHTGEKPYSCNICNKCFSVSGHLKSHQRTHFGEKPYSCQICKKSFSRSSNLKNHLRTHSGEKPYSCQICKKSFSESGTLKRHLRTHSGEKPFSCNLCKKSFPVSSSLKLHLRTHSGEKPFSCQICKKSFSGNSNLKTHLRTHSY